MEHFERMIFKISDFKFQKSAFLPGAEIHEIGPYPLSGQPGVVVTELTVHFQNLCAYCDSEGWGTLRCDSCMVRAIMES